MASSERIFQAPLTTNYTIIVDEWTSETCESKGVTVLSVRKATEPETNPLIDASPSRLLHQSSQGVIASSVQLQFGDVNVSGTSILKRGVRVKPVEISFTSKSNV